MKTYTQVASAKSFISDCFLQWKLLRRGIADVDTDIRRRHENFGGLAGSFEALRGQPFTGCDVLEIGHGQFPFTSAFIAARDNRVVGIDIDPVPQRFSPITYARMLRTSGLRRTVKTVGREVTGINRAYRQSIARVTGRKRFPKLDLRVMDACELDFPDASFDAVYSFDVFEHLDRPEKAAEEIVRVLKPGGAAVLIFVHGTWYNALHDLRMLSLDESPIPPWAHLRERFTDQVQQGAYVNGLKIGEWRELFERIMPGAEIHMPHVQQQRLLDEFAAIRSGHEIDHHTDDELLVDHVTVKWKKP